MLYNLKNCPGYTKPYIIKKGDTLSKIAESYGTTVKALMYINQGLYPENLIPGTQICVPRINETPLCPNGKYYTVLPGDTLFSIASRFNISIKNILMSNKFDNPYSLISGQKICIPIKKICCPNGKLYTVQNGDTLSKILIKNDISIYSLINANKGLNLEKIREGQKLCIPESKPYKKCLDDKTYIIQEGDNLVTIAENYLVKTDDLLLYNPKMRPSDFETVGLLICIPIEEVPV